MSNLFIFYGASGTGKTTLSSHILDLNYQEVEIIKVHTNRKPRKSEINGSFELDFFEKLNKKDYIFVFSKYGNNYGIPYSAIKKIKSNPNKKFIIILCDIKASKELKNKVKAKLIYIYSPKNIISKRLIKRGDKDFENRIKGFELIHFSYRKNIINFDFVVFNDMSEISAYNQLISIMGVY